MWLNSKMNRFLSEKTEKHDFKIDFSFFAQSGLFCPNGQFWPILEVKKSKITIWAIVDIWICFLGRNFTQKSIPHG